MPPARSDADYRMGFRTIDREFADVALTWEGSIPTWMQGTYLQNGAGRFEVGDHEYKHWFDGLAYLRRVRFGDDCSFTGRYLQSKDLQRSTSSDRPRFTEFATAPRRSWLGKLLSTIDPPSQFGENNSVNFMSPNGQIQAIGDTPTELVVDPNTLEVTGHGAQQGLLLLTRSPHPLYDPERKEWVNVGVGADWRGIGYHCITLADGSDKRRSLAFLPRLRPAYMHSFGMSRRWIVITEHPFHAELHKLATMGLLDKPIVDAFDWEPDRPLKFLLVDRDTGRHAATIETDGVFYFHHINVFDDDGDVVVDLCTYPDDAVIGELYLDHLRSDGGGRSAVTHPVRYRLDPVRGTASSEPLADTSFEFPTIDARRLMEPHRFSYGIGIAPDRRDDYLNQLVRLDGEAGDRRTWSEAGCYPGEPLFVPRPGGTDEDDGVVMFLGLDAAAERSFVGILDGQTFELRARAELPAVLPFALHGQYYPEAASAAATDEDVDA